MQEGRAEWVTSLLFFHFVRITTDSEDPVGWWRKRPTPTASESRRTCGRGPRGAFGGSGPCLPVGRLTRPSGGNASLRRGRSPGRAGEGERRPGRRRGEVPPGPARVRPDALPLVVQPRPTGLAVPAATSR